MRIKNRESRSILIDRLLRLLRNKEIEKTCKIFDRLIRLITEPRGSKDGLFLNGGFRDIEVGNSEGNYKRSSRIVS